jgi:hypothetical protein
MSQPTPSAPTFCWVWDFFPLLDRSAYGCRDARARVSLMPRRNLRYPSDLQFLHGQLPAQGHTFRVMIQNPNRNQEHVGVGREYHVPTADDVAIVRELYPDAADPENPQWTRIVADLVSAGVPKRELRQYNAPELIRLLRKVNQDRRDQAPGKQSKAPSEGDTPPDSPPPPKDGSTGPHADLRDFARKNLKGKEQAVIEALCDANGERPIADLVIKAGLGWVGWDGQTKGFKNVQRRLNPKLKPEGWRLERRKNAATLLRLKALKRR